MLVGQDRRGNEAAQYRRWYGLPEWKALRVLRLQNEPLCRMCLPRTVAATIVDHVTPHRGSWDLFIAYDNTQSLCEMHHNKWKQAMERSIAQAVDENGWPIERPFSWHPAGLKPSRVPLVIVCGAPASGKTSYVAARRAADDTVIDLDEIGAGLDDGDTVNWDRTKLRAAGEQRNKLLEGLSQRRCGSAWFIVGEPNPSWRQWWQNTLRPSEIVVLETPADVCLSRCTQHERRRKRLAEYTTAIDAWWSSYLPRVGDVVIRLSAD